MMNVYPNITRYVPSGHEDGLKLEVVWGHDRAEVDGFIEAMKSPSSKVREEYDRLATDFVSSPAYIEWKVAVEKLERAKVRLREAEDDFARLKDHTATVDEDETLRSRFLSVLTEVELSRARLPALWNLVNEKEREKNRAWNDAVSALRGRLLADVVEDYNSVVELLDDAVRPLVPRLGEILFTRSAIKSGEHVPACPE